MGDAAQELAQALVDYDGAQLVEILKASLEQRPEVLQELVEWAVPNYAMVSTRLFSEQRMTGVVKSFSHGNNYGFIECPETMEAFGADVFVHGRQLMQAAGQQFQVGETVSFVVLLNKQRKPQAFDVQPPKADGSVASAKPSLQASPYMPAGGSAKGAAAKGNVGAAGKAAGKGYWAFADAGWGMDSWGKGWPWGAPAMYKGAAAAKGAMAGQVVGGKGKGALLDREWMTDAPPSAAEMPGITDQRWQGSVKSFRPDKGYGFIECAELFEQFNADTFVHHKQLEGCNVGDDVSFAVFLNKDHKPQAKDLELINSNAAKRARVS